MVYLDYAAHFPMSWDVADKIHEVFQLELGSPGGIHAAAAEARATVQQSRRELAELLNVRPQELFFTSGGTESNNWAIKCGIRSSGKRHMIVSAAEHKSVLESARAMEKEGFAVTYIKPDAHGLVSLDSIEAALRPDTGLISVQSVNNETGVIQDLAGIAALAKSRRILCHCDAVQSFAHSPLPLERADLVSLSAHKLGGPVGLGLLVMRQPLLLPPLIHGGGQELGLRSGTENAAGIAGFALAAKLSCRSMEAEHKRLASLSVAFEALLTAAVPGAEINGAAAPRQPGIVNCFFPGMRAEELVTRLDMHGICASPGAACAARDTAPSHVLMAMGLGRERAECSVRFSMGRETDMEALSLTAKTLGQILRREI